LAGLELKVALSRREVLMTHLLHDPAGVGGADRVGAEGVAEVVEAQLAESGLFQRGPVRTDPPLDLAAVRQPVLRVPLRPRLRSILKTWPLIALVAWRCITTPYVHGGDALPRLPETTCPRFLAGLRDIFGDTIRGLNPPRYEKIPHLRGFCLIPLRGFEPRFPD
jgi:hypothetical protein